MELQKAKMIIETLAQGIHPVTGELMPEDSPYNAPPVIRALFAVSQALDTAQRQQQASGAVTSMSAGESLVQRGKPPVNAGKPWSESEDETLISRFDEFYRQTDGNVSSSQLKVLAEDMGRTRFGIEQRLIKLGKITIPDGQRQGSAA